MATARSPATGNTARSRRTCSKGASFRAKSISCWSPHRPYPLPGRSKLYCLLLRRRPMLPILLATYGTVFIAEIVGDKLLYTTGVLATRYRTAPILFGMACAFMAKMAVAVLVGKAISTLPRLLVAAITTINFFAIAWALWRK